jgi:UDP-N-acetylmuramoyl-L-alanyl-D-glutamate--2,6-diaminopimelate ligase
MVKEQIKLSALIRELKILSKIGSKDPVITGLSYDSRDVEPGHIFFAFDGVHTDGHLYINNALDNGAAAVIHSRKLEEYKDSIVYILVDKTRPALSIIASAFYPSRELCIIGVTGTDGKSTTVWFIHQLLTFFNKTSGFISTVNIASKKNINKNPYRQSTPEAREIHEFLKNLKDSNVEFAVLEATSHGLSEKTARLKNVNFNVGVLTNVTHEHLEFHGSLKQYRNDKANLFRWIGKQSGNYSNFGVVNKDDPNWELFKKSCNHPVYTYSMEDTGADLYADSIKQEENGCSLRLVLKNNNLQKEEINVFFPIQGLFNVYNLMAAVLTICKLLNNPLVSFTSYIKKIKGVRGRMEVIDEGQPFKVIVDYAHTPKSFEKIFPYIKECAEKRLISVFGSAGERDIEKRAVQGEIASNYSDIVIITDEDPRGEDRMKIIKDIASGCRNMELFKDLFLIPDRRKAIKYALEIAESGDTVLCLGKGHEESIIYEKSSIPWNEIEVTRELLKTLKNIKNN